MEWGFVFILVFFFLAVAAKRGRECMEERKLRGNVSEIVVFFSLIRAFRWIDIKLGNHNEPMSENTVNWLRNWINFQNISQYFQVECKKWSPIFDYQQDLDNLQLHG